ncbi:hypothetical protein H072_10660 [Dactylellina haptotyla CBS 200.50]|uniref:Uncharacterized protein n=1 Tax=Dactylellina haptotyla (strain CBS 200.50) TaxID=1284197 RepID=S8BKW9_DACHA|nr:hypothetical protein H072_10660 [Dactylellina haptotyla CBS 200.50]
MEVNHEAMKQATSASGTQPAGDNRNTMEYDPNSAPQIMDPTNPPMSFRSGAVADQYESYPEVMPPGGLNTPSGYPSSTSPAPSGSGPSYDGYQTVSQHPAPPNQPLLQNQQGEQYSNAPMAAGAEKTYYQPTYGVSQPPPPPPSGYSNANTLVQPDQNNAPTTKYGLPAPITYNAPPNTEKKILGLKKKTFWIVLIIVIIVILGAVGGAVGGILGSKKSNNNNNNNNNNSSSGGTNSGGNNNGTSSGGNNGAYTPFALTTGVRTLNLKYQQNSGSCNDPQNADGSGVVNCFATSRYTVRVDGDVASGYRLSSVDVAGSTFSNIRGTPPTTSDPNQQGSAWVFEVRFTQSGTCGTDRVTRYVLGVNDDTYAVGEGFTLKTQCTLANGLSFPSGTSCTCVALSTSVNP